MTAARRCGTSAHGNGSATSSPSAPASSLRSDRKSTRLNSSHANISYAVFCLKKNDNDPPGGLPDTATGRQPDSRFVSHSPRDVVPLPAVLRRAGGGALPSLPVVGAGRPCYGM